MPLEAGEDASVAARSHMTVVMNHLASLEIRLRKLPPGRGLDVDLMLRLVAEATEQAEALTALCRESVR